MQLIKELTNNDWKALLDEIEEKLGRDKREYIEHKVKTLELMLELGEEK